MAKTKISEFNANPALNTDIDSINISEGCAPSGINDAIRELMSQLKDWQSGTSNDPYVVGSSGSLTLNQGTANTVPYLNGSKVVTSGTALSFDGTNLGLGVTPSTWSAVTPALQIGGAGSFIAAQGNSTPAIYVGANASYNGSNWVYKISNVATMYAQDTGEHKWFRAASGTAGNAITFTQAMTLDASGNLLVGTTSSDGSRLRVYGSYQTLGDGAYEGLIGKASSLVSGGGAGDFAIRSAANLVFSTNGNTERARIDSSGNLLVGTTSAPAKLSIAYTTTAVFGIDIKPSADSGAYAIYFRNAANSGVGSITTSASATSYNTSSDYRLKNTIAPMTGALAKVALLKPCTYKWNVDGSDGQGFIAHELAEVVPQCVTGDKDAVDEDGNPKYQGIDTSFLVATLTAALQELNAKFDAYVASHP